MSELKKENPMSRNRIKLLGFLQQLDVSVGTKIKIGRMLEDGSDGQIEQRKTVNGHYQETQKELKAKELLELFSGCKSEEEILSTLYQHIRAGEEYHGRK